jgi:hypothetical protein
VARRDRHPRRRAGRLLRRSEGACRRLRSGGGGLRGRARRLHRAAGVGVVRRWRWMFWLVLVAFLRVPASCAFRLLCWSSGGSCLSAGQPGMCSCRLRSGWCSSRGGWSRSRTCKVLNTAGLQPVVLAAWVHPWCARQESNLHCPGSRPGASAWLGYWRILSARLDSNQQPSGSEPDASARIGLRADACQTGAAGHGAWEARLASGSRSAACAGDTTRTCIGVA